MALSNIFGWHKKEEQAGSACGTACGAAGKLEDKPAACGTACGAAEKQHVVSAGVQFIYKKRLEKLRFGGITG